MIDFKITEFEITMFEVTKFEVTKLKIIFEPNFIYSVFKKITLNLDTLNFVPYLHTKKLNYVTSNLYPIPFVIVN